MARKRAATGRPAISLLATRRLTVLTEIAKRIGLSEGCNFIVEGYVSSQKALAMVVLYSMTVAGLRGKEGFVTRVVASSNCCSLISVAGRMPLQANDAGDICRVVKSAAGGKALAYAVVRRENAKAFNVPRSLDPDSLGAWQDRYVQYLRDGQFEESADVLVTPNGCRVRLGGSQGVQTIQRFDSQHVSPAESHLHKSVVYVDLHGTAESPRYGAVFVYSTEPSEFVSQVSIEWPAALRSSFEFVIRPDRCFGQYPYFPSVHPLERNAPCPIASSNVQSTVCETMAEQNSSQWRCHKEPLLK